MSTDVIRLICPNLKCRAILVAPSHARGKAVRCRECGVKVRVPDGAGAKDAPARTATPGATGDKA